MKEISVSEHYIEREWQYKGDHLSVEQHPNGVTIVKVLHPEFWVDTEYPTDTYYGSSFSPPNEWHPRNLKVFVVMKYAKDYKTRLSELGEGDFIYVLHRLGEDEWPNRYVVVRHKKN